MGNFLSGKSSLAAVKEITTVETTADGNRKEKKRSLSKESRQFMNKTVTMLSVILPSMRTIMHHRDEGDMMRQICGVLDKVTQHYHPDFSVAERQQLLLHCVPPRESGAFRAVLLKFRPGEKIRAGRADVDLMRMVRLWFEADKDNSGELDEDEVGQLLVSLGICISSRELKQLMSSIDESGDGALQFDEFYRLYVTLTTVEAVVNLFQRCCTRRVDREVLNAVAAALAAADGNDDGDGGDGSDDGSSRDDGDSAEGVEGGRAGRTGEEKGDKNGGKKEKRGVRSSRGLAAAEALLANSQANVVLTPAALSRGIGGPDFPRLAREANMHPILVAHAALEHPIVGIPDGDARVLGVHDLDRFLRGVQRLTYHPKAMEHVRAACFGEMRLIDGIKGVAPRQFQNALLDPIRNSWFDPRECLVHQDMEQPLSHYFIDSSHNTFLTGNQFNSPSSVEMYRQALREACRCVAVECHDGPDGQPVVANGKGAASVAFREVVEVIHQNAFATSPYPVILSLEVHCSDLQQGVIARTLREVFGDALMTSAEADATRLHSPGFTPARLLRRVLVKAKRLQEMTLDAIGQSNDVSAIAAARTAAQVAARPGAQALSALAFIEARRFNNIAAARRWPHFAVASIDETRAVEWGGSTNEAEKAAAAVAAAVRGASTAASGGVAEMDAGQCRELTKGVLLRTYPYGVRRLDSSNYNPQIGWNVGAQMVALNYQTLDHAMRLNRARFNVNGRCGYVLKPRCMRTPGIDPRSFGDRMRLTVNVICGVQLPRPLSSRGRAARTNEDIIDPHVELWITGVDDDDTSARPHRTKVVHNNGFNPVWNEVFTFTINSLEMAILTLRVVDNDRNEIVGEASIVASALRQGYRSVGLYADNGVMLPPPTALFCRIELDPIGVSVEDADL